MTTYRQGQRVKVEYEATVLDASDTRLMINPDHYGAGLQHHISLPPPSGLSVTVLDPPDWPPQQGDIWKITWGALEGYEFFIRRSSQSTGRLIVTPQDGGSAWTLDMLQAYDPVLVRRRDQ